eukprot:300067-Amphidinium_carterae.1
MARAESASMRPPLSRSAPSSPCFGQDHQARCIVGRLWLRADRDKPVFCQTPLLSPKFEIY